MKKTKSSHRWLREHEDDEFVKRARIDGYRSRASYKLLEINEKFKLIEPGNCVLDLGAAPGGWSQVAAKCVGNKGRVIALDILEMEAIKGVTFICGDFTEEEPHRKLLETVKDSNVDLVISDMAPNLSGMKHIDLPRSVYLVDSVLKKGGNLVTKCFEGEGIGEIRQSFRQRFRKVVNFKPKSSKAKSREIYVIGLEKINNPAE